MKRICKKCKTEKDITLFVKGSNVKNGYRYCCKECHNVKHRKGPAKNNSGWFKKGHKMWPGSEKTWIKKGERLSPSTEFGTKEPWNKGKQGKPLTPEQRKFLSGLHKGEKSHRWKGGVTPIHDAIRKSVEYKLWREAVFTRDDYTCQACGQRGGNLHADHELPFAHYPDLRFEVLNGRTLCVPCHRKTPTYGYKAGLPQLT